ncbi:hypothetical protein GA0115236_12061, partial [Streptomyces sp. IgraMP-1]
MTGDVTGPVQGTYEGKQAPAAAQEVQAGPFALPGNRGLQVFPGAAPVLFEEGSDGQAQATLERDEQRVLAPGAPEPQQRGVPVAAVPLVGGEGGVGKEEVAVGGEVAYPGGGVDRAVDGGAGLLPVAAEHGVHGEQSVHRLGQREGAEFPGGGAGGRQPGRVARAQEGVGAEPDQGFRAPGGELVAFGDLEHPLQAGVRRVETLVPAEQAEQLPRLAGDHRQAVLLGDGRGPAGGFGGVGGAVLARSAGKQDEVALDHGERGLLAGRRCGAEQGAGGAHPAPRLLV